ncbi:MAG: pirin family protein [Candidatus Melainabacteria bacterium]
MHPSVTQSSQGSAETHSSLRIRHAGERGHTRLDWLESYHTFSFGDYEDTAWMGFGPLRVINDDWIAPAGGFGMHGHRDMEILTCVLEGELAHEDSLKNGATITPGEWQRMTAGTGIRHSEFNASDDRPVHLLQIWIQPDQPGLAPGYEQKSFSGSLQPRQWQLIASPTGEGGSLIIHQQARVYQALLFAGEAIDYAPSPGRGLWLHVATGSVQLGGQLLRAGDAISLLASGPTEQLVLSGTAAQSHLILFDLPIPGL